MSKTLSEKEYEKMHDDLTVLILKYSNHLIKDHIKSNTFTLTNGFDVVFRDRKRNRE